jgi:hypothetical protein
MTGGLLLNAASMLSCRAMPIFSTVRQPDNIAIAHNPKIIKLLRFIFHVLYFMFPFRSFAPPVKRPVVKFDAERDCQPHTEIGELGSQDG